MGVEPERKFLLASDDWKNSVSDKSHITQAYIKDAGADVFIRVTNDTATLFIEGKIDRDVKYALDIPAKDAKEILHIFGKKSPTLRIRLMDDAEGFVTIKGKRPEGSIETPEFEYKIPIDDAKNLLKICNPNHITKTRHYVEFSGNTWEVDVFEGANKGLVVAEIELPSGNSTFEKPAWAGEEVTFDAKYTNAALSGNPYSEWKKNPPVRKPSGLKP